MHPVDSLVASMPHRVTLYVEQIRDRTGVREPAWECCVEQFPVWAWMSLPDLADYYAGVKNSRWLKSTYYFT